MTLEATIEPSGANAEQIEFWNSQAAQGWVVSQDVLDRLLAPLGKQLLEAASVLPGESVLDLGCGCGETVLQLAAQGARVTGIDISAPMLARARERMSGVSGVTLVLADAATHPFEPVHDLIFSRFGAMFFAEPVAAYANLRQALRPGGRLCFLCWQAPDRNPWLMVPGAAVQALLPAAAPADPRAPGPFALADPDWVREIVSRAGFAAVALQSVHHTMRLGASLDQAMDLVTRVGLVARALREVGPERQPELLAAVRAALEPHARCGPVELAASCWIVRASWS